MGAPKNECDIDSGKVETARQTFDDLFSRISGRSGEYNLITEPVGFDFSGLVGDSLRAAANENQSAWQSSMSACLLAFGVLSEVYDAVVDYDEKIDDIITRYNTYVTNLGDTLSPESVTIMASYQTEADTALTTLKTKLSDAEGKLEGGATPENIRTLAEAGHFGENGQIGYYIHEDLNYLHVDESQAETIAIHLRDGVLNGYGGSLEALEDNPELLALISNIAIRANTAERNGEKLSDGEIAFLETLHEELEGLDEDGFLGFVNQIESSEHISDSLREEITRSLSNGTLALSNEAVGGGMDLLPHDVQQVALGPEPFDPQAVINGADPQDFLNDYRDWGSDFGTLADYLSSSGPGIKGGTEFSTSLLATTSSNIHFVDFYGREPDDSVYQDIIDVAARNPEANNIMLTGNDFDGNEYEHHERHQGVTPESFLSSIYTRDWPDDGSAVSKVTDWIDHFQASDEPEEVDLGSEAFLALLETITTPEMQERLGETRHSIEDEENDVTWENVSFTHLNPEIADSFADLFLNNIEAMESSVGFSIDPDGLKDPSVYEVDSEYKGDGDLRIDPMTRLAFAEYIVGSEQAATRLEAASYFRSEEAAATYFGEYPPDESEPREAGIFAALIDDAINNEHDKRVEATNGAIDYKNQVSNGSVDMVSAVFNEIPVPGVSTVSEVMKQGFKEVLSIDHVDVSRDTSSDYSQIAADNRAAIHAAVAVENSGDHVFGEEVEYLRDPETGNINLDPNFWFEQGDFDEELYQEAVDSIRGDLRDREWYGAERELGGSVIGDFSQANSAGRQALEART
ncbi:hypothetical protein [Nocardiopsis sp. NPDC058789]|uniref:TPR repeat region-containing protein n=1 Tax=Nocardiopsis sp. NPDC058789 TaxID=3346634 RepID=UPI00366BDBF0